MRRAVIAVLLVACEKGLPPEPDPAKYSAMSEDERCKAAEPRALRCVDELMIADLEMLASGGLDIDAIKRDLEAAPRAKGDQARAIHRASCKGSLATEYQDAVVACWKSATCKDLAECVKTKRTRPPSP